jgi:uncharacterized protein (DUF1800 family)
MTAWHEYTPSSTNPWTLQKAGHLYRRAAFGATHAQLEQAVKDGPKATITKLLKGEPESADYTDTSNYMSTERALPPTASTTRLAAWWLWRIRNSPHPLREKLSVFWHNHFATSQAKVQQAQYMVGMIRTIHTHALGDFRVLLNEMTFDPAMLIWLDAKDSKKGQPNENYARELMELFSLGLGNYTEADIREAARAFTGYDVKSGKMVFDAKQHDDGEKTVFGKKGKYQAGDVVKLCLGHSACAKFIVKKLYREFISDLTEPSDELLKPLVELYRKSFNTGEVVETMLRSEQFFSDSAYRQKVKSPVEFALGLVTGLEGTAGPELLALACDELGQTLGAPPSVKGWDGGPTWLNAQTLLTRQNLALALVSTEDNRFGKRCDPVKLLVRHKISDDAETLEFLLKLFLQDDLPKESRDQLAGYLKQSITAKYPSFWTKQDIAEHRTRTVTHLVLTRPEFQLG